MTLWGLKAFSAFLRRSEVISQAAHDMKTETPLEQIAHITLEPAQTAYNGTLLKMASLTGFAPVISCMRGRHVG